jgi:dipeptidyl aminopeptidase/acylaminoacyl peptidase
MTKRTATVQASVLCLLLSFGAGCGTVAGVRSDELESLADSPIALVYWNPVDARRRLDIFDDMQGVPQGRGQVGYAHVNDVTALLSPDDPNELQRRLSTLPGRIALLNPHTLEITRFPAAPPNARPLAWSPDRTRLLFASYHRDGQTSQLFEYDSKSGEVRKLTRGPAHHLEADYASDGRLVVSRVERRAQSIDAGIDVQPTGGGLAEPLIEGRYGSSVRWSPQGDEIVYVHADNRAPTATRRDGSTIVTQRVEPGAEPNVLSRGREPVFTPDGEWIVFTSQSSKGWQLQRMRPDGSARRSMGRTPRDDRQPAVSPDGRFVVYVSVDDEGQQRLFLRRFDGTGDRRLLPEGAGEYPVW